MARRMPLLTLGWILLGLAGTLPLAAADRNLWTPVGPDLSTVRALAAAPSGVVYAGTTVRGVFRSSDGGARWSVPSQIPGRFARELVIDPGNPRGVYALSEAGLFYSRNGGAWQGRRGSMGGPYNAFAVSTSEPSHLYLYDGVFLQVSHDRGRNWESLSTPWNDILVLKVHPRDPDTLFAGLFDSRVWKSTDGGSSWRETQWNGPTQGFISVRSLAFDPGNPNVIYAGTVSNGIWKSTDAGETWNSVFTVSGAFDAVLALAVDPSQSSRIYAAVDRPRDDQPAAGEIWRSEDAGASWSRQFATTTPAFSLAIDPGNPRTVYAGFEWQGVLKSTNRGASWKPARAGLAAYRVNDIERDAHQQGGLWIAVPEPSTFFEDIPGRFIHPGLFHTADGGASWSSFDRGFDGSFYPERIVSDPVHEVVWTFGGGQFYRSFDGGSSWHPVDALFGLSATAFVPDPVFVQQIFLAGWRREGIEFPFDVPIVWRSLDRGDTWEELDGGFDLRQEGRGRMTGLAVSPIRPQTVYAGGTFGFFRSRNSGDTWERISADFPQACNDSSLVVDPFVPSTLYAIRCDNPLSVYKSADNGAHWQPTALSLPSGVFFLHELVADPRRPGTLYAAGDAGVFVTGDRGAHWRALTGLPAGAPVLALEIDSNSGRIYAGTDGAGLFLLTRR